MSTAKKVFLSYALVISAGLGYLAYLVLEDLSPRYRETVEESLVDTANILATVAEELLTTNQDLSLLFNATTNAKSRRFEARIYEILKTGFSLRVYITDRQGKVLFHSQHPEEVGKDYSKWNDVFLSLNGQYGARSTRDNFEDSSSTVLYVSAPIRGVDGVAGVVTVGKPTRSFTVFVERARKRFIYLALILGGALILIGFLLSAWITIPLRRLTVYARSVRDGKSVKLPKLGRTELGEFGRVLEEMKAALEGKQYVEQYVQSLTHELKSPLSGIRGSAELLLEELPLVERQKFTEHIVGEVRRMESLVNRMLELASVEARGELAGLEKIEPQELIKEVINRVQVNAKERSIVVQFKAEVRGSLQISGEHFLLAQALENLLINAIDFSNSGGKIEVSLVEDGNNIQFIVQDEGTGIPEYALGRIYDRFYSLTRPESGRKSSGLGLTFVREIAQLHGGRVVIENRAVRGVIARLILPITR